MRTFYISEWHPSLLRHKRCLVCRSPVGCTLQKKRMVVPAALKIVRLKPSRKVYSRKNKIIHFTVHIGYTTIRMEPIDKVNTVDFPPHC